ncbi:unnamed protein product, partial [Prorocentrum cordatum]
RRRRRRRRRRCRRRIATAAATTECSRKRWWESRPTVSWRASTSSGEEGERSKGEEEREGGKQGGREERGLEARIPAADGPERGTQTPLPIRACSPSARSRTGGGPERDVRRGGPSLKARKSPSLPRCCL